MPYTKVLIHFIWATNREHLISKELKPLLLQHIKENSIKKEYEEFLNADDFERVLAKANT